MHPEPPMKRVATIIADGPLSSRSRAYTATKSRLLTEARLRYAQQAKEASLLARIRLEWKIQREVRAELKKRYPPHALYANAPFKFRA